MKKKIVYFIATAPFFAVILFVPLYSHPSLNRIREEVDRARAAGHSVKKTNIQELLQNAGSQKDVGNDLSSLFHHLDSLEWANQRSFITTLLDHQQNAPEQVLNLLKDQVMLFHAHEKYPFIMFVYQLKNEYDIIQQSTTRLFSMINKRDCHDGLSVQQGLEKITKLKDNLELLLNLVNDLL